MSKLSNLKLDARQILIASLPSDLPDSFFCPPPAAKTEPVQGLAALADSGQAVGIIHFRRYPLAFQFTEPRGFWSSASGSRFGREFVRRFPALRFTPA